MRSGFRKYEKQSHNYQELIIIGKDLILMKSRPRNFEIFSHLVISHCQPWLQDKRVGRMAISYLICFYYLLGMRHWEIFILLNVDLKSLGSFRQKALSDLLEVAFFLQ